MNARVGRRDFLKTAIAGSALCLGCNGRMRTPGTGPCGPACTKAGLVSPGCRRSKVRVAKVYAGTP